MPSENSVPFNPARPGALKPGKRLRFSGAEWRAMEAPAVHIMAAGGSNPRVSAPSLSLVWNTCPAADNLPAARRGTAKPPTQNVTFTRRIGFLFFIALFSPLGRLTDPRVHSHTLQRVKLPSSTEDKLPQVYLWVWDQLNWMWQSLRIQLLQNGSLRQWCSLMCSMWDKRSLAVNEMDLIHQKHFKKLKWGKKQTNTKPKTKIVWHL